MYGKPTKSKICKDAGVHASIEGDRFMGAALGSLRFKQDFVERKITSWVTDIGELCVVAKEEPQIAYWAFTKDFPIAGSPYRGLLKSYELFKPLEDALSQFLTNF